MVARSPAGAVRACIGAGAVGAGPNTVTSGSASGQLEAGDPGLPTVSEWRGRRALHRVVLVDVPERAVINRVHGQVGVVTPARVHVRLGGRTVDGRSFAERHLPERIAGESPGVADAGEHVRAVDDAVSERHIAVLVRGDTAHPAVHAIARRIRALLVDAVLAVRPPDLVPPNAGDTGHGLDRLVGHHRLGGAEVSVRQSERWPLPVGQDVQELCRVGDAGLWQAVPRAETTDAREYRVEWRHRKLRLEYQ